MARRRLDAELVRRGLVQSRERARDVIAAGHVMVGGMPADKASRQVGEADPITLAGEGAAWASRGAGKLIGALRAFTASGLRPMAGRWCLDAGASSGGFTDVLLAQGAAGVLAVDVGYGQLAWRLQRDPRVVVLDRTNVRHLEPGVLPWRPDLVVADLSFISLSTVLPALHAVTDATGDMLLMVKPQFEVGRASVPRSGVVRDSEQRAGAVQAVCAAAHRLGWGTASVAASMVPGPSGNVEYFVWLNRTAGPVQHDVIVAAIAEGPQG